MDKNEKTILIAEDEDINYLFIEELLIDHPFKLVRVTNGQECIDYFEKENKKADIILMDIKMPILNGLEATKKIKEKHPEIPIIAQTAYAMKSDRDEAIRYGCDDYISKPIIGSQLIEMILTHVNSK